MAKTVFDLNNCRAFFRDFRGFLRPCEALHQVKKQQIKVKFWISGPRTVCILQHDMCPNFFVKNHSTLMQKIGTR